MKDLQGKVVRYVANLFEEHTHQHLVYHNLLHTLLVVTHTEELIDHNLLTDEEKFIVRTAAWFHDTGHLITKMQGHEEASVELMKKCLTPLNLNSHLLQSIADCILATKMPSHPVQLVEQILCDADTWHLGTEEFAVINDKVREELYLREGLEFTNWTNHSVDFLKKHRYYTSYAKRELNFGKRKNLQALENCLFGGS